MCLRNPISLVSGISLTYRKSSTIFLTSNPESDTSLKAHPSFYPWQALPSAVDRRGQESGYLQQWSDAALGQFWAK